jgi:endonuclease/exonuclease/phosphatase family metal-dependent hydrolase
MHLVRPRRIDYIMVRGPGHGPTLDVLSCELAFTEPVDGVQASDHYGVVADLAVPARPPGQLATPLPT